jgi:probable HAF family extracellular repeat protein
MYRTLAHHQLLYRALFLVGVLTGLVLRAPTGAWALTYTFTTVDAPNTTFNEAFGINDFGHIVGYCGSANCNFIDDGGSFTLVYVYGEFLGINNSDNIVGIYFGTPSRGFLYANGIFATIEVPGATSTDVFGINDSGDIVGSYRDAMDMTHGFLYANGKFTTLDFPGARVTVAYDINNFGTIVGHAQGYGGFLYSNGSFTHIDLPCVTSVNGINGFGDIVGTCFDGLGRHGFVYAEGIFTKLDIPGIPSPNFMEARGINNAGIIVGIYQGDPDTAIHGFMATPVSTTPPVVTITATPATLWPPNGRMAPVVISGTITDARSGVDVSTAAYAVIDEYRQVQPMGSVTLRSDGRYSFTIQLQASRNGNEKRSAIHHYRQCARSRGEHGVSGYRRDCPPRSGPMSMVLRLTARRPG